MSDFFAGQRVVCIDGSFHPCVWEWVDQVPLEGEVYTITSVRLGGREKVTGKVGPALRLLEIPNGLSGQGVYWIVRRFAPLDLADSCTAIKTTRKAPKRKSKPAPVRRKHLPAASPA